jgi:uncharacterized YccA/Bax inhibitor family protein
MANPAFSDSFIRDQYATGETTFTAQGAAVKTLVLLVIMAATFSYTWVEATEGYATAFSTADAADRYPTSISIPPNVIGLALVGAIGGLIVAFITIFKQSVAPYTAPVYAALEGLFLGALSAGFEARYPGIVMQAMGGVVGTTGVMALLYSSGILRPTQKFVTGVVAATGGVCMLYFVDIIMGFFGSRISMVHDASWMGIGLQVAIVAIAALNLILDFGTITEAAENKAPKWFEWYAAFGLMITIVWLYIEMLRLLAKLRASDD